MFGSLLLGTYIGLPSDSHDEGPLRLLAYRSLEQPSQSRPGTKGGMPFPWNRVGMASLLFSFLLIDVKRP